MANEVTFADLVSNGGRLQKYLSPLVHATLYDPTGVRALMTQYGAENPGAATLNVAKVTRGLAMSAASTETSGGFSNAAVTTGNFDLTIARYGLKVQATDLYQVTSTGTALNVPYLLGMLQESLDLTLTDLMTAAFANLANNVGTSGADMTFDDFMDGKYFLNLQNNGAQLAAVLHPQQINDLEESLVGLGGAVQFRQDVQRLFPVGPGFKGNLVGVDVYQSDSCALANTNADRRGAMFAAGCYAYRLGMVDMGLMVNPFDIVVATPELFIERIRDGANAMTTFQVNSYPAIAEAEDLRGVRITTDA